MIELSDSSATVAPGLLDGDGRGQHTVTSYLTSLAGQPKVRHQWEVRCGAPDQNLEVAGLDQPGAVQSCESRSVSMDGEGDLDRGPRFDGDSLEAGELSQGPHDLSLYVVQVQLDDLVARAAPDVGHGHSHVEPAVGRRLC